MRNTGSTLSKEQQRQQKRALIRSQAFQTGFMHVKGGIPYEYDPVPHAPAVAAYERGRQFAYVYNGPLVDERGEPTPMALVNLRRAARLKEVV